MKKYEKKSQEMYKQKKTENLKEKLQENWFISTSNSGYFFTRNFSSV